MKNKLHYFILLFVLAALTGCNEKLSIETEIQGAPEISEFTPTSGKAGTEITVKGSNLRDIVSATIGGVESQILYKLSQQEIVIVVPREGTKAENRACHFPQGRCRRKHPRRKCAIILRHLSYSTCD